MAPPTLQGAGEMSWHTGGAQGSSFIHTSTALLPVGMQLSLGLNCFTVIPAWPEVSWGGEAGKVIAACSVQGDQSKTFALTSQPGLSFPHSLR